VREKVKKGIKLALKKRGVEAEVIERTVTRVENGLHDKGQAVVPSSVVGEMVMSELREIDEVAYLRFASVCDDFVSVSQFKRAAEKLKK